MLTEYGSLPRVRVYKSQTLFDHRRMIGAVDIRGLDADGGAARPGGRSPSAEVVPGGRVHVRTDTFDVELHPLWLRERCRCAASVDPANGQRLHEPTDLPAGLAVVSCSTRGAGLSASLDITFSDGHRSTLALAELTSTKRAVERPPRPTPWSASGIDALPIFDYRLLDSGGLGSAGAKREILESFFTLGFFVLRNTPAVADALREITAHFGRISATNFGELFDVRTESVPVDLAYTPVALSAHTDQPYRTPTPGLQFLHTIVNDAPGGASTMVDGLAAVEALAAADPEAHELLCSLPVEFRYDIGTDVKVLDAPIIERRPDGSLRQLRFSTRLDFAPLVDADTLDVFYRGRQWLACWLNDARHQIEYRMEAGDVLVVDNHRVLHGRTAFDPTHGNRHLQGCYIDHDGPLTEWILTTRSLADTVNRKGHA